MAPQPTHVLSALFPMTTCISIQFSLIIHPYDIKYLNGTAF
jgi:hypothetical protein